MSKVLSSDGRWLITAPMGYKGKTYIGNRYVFQYRLLMEQKIGRLLEPWEEIHHINGNKLDDGIENLEIKNKKEHQAFHSILRKGKPNFKCSECNEEFHPRPCIKKRNISGTIFCSRDCYKKFVKINNWGK